MKHFLTAALLLTAAGASTAQVRKLTIAPGLSASISYTPGAGEVKVLMAGMDTLSLDLHESKIPVRTIKTADYNFDGYKDFAVTVREGESPAFIAFDVFLYRPADKTFEALEPGGGACEVFGNVRVTAGDKSLRASCRGTGARLQTDIYKYTDPYTLTFVRTLNSAEDKEAAAEEKAETKEEAAERRAEKKDDKADKAAERRDSRAAKKEERDDSDDDE